jgi:hypothetical protein
MSHHSPYLHKTSRPTLLCNFPRPHLTSIRVLLLHSYSLGVLFHPRFIFLFSFHSSLQPSLVWTLFRLLDTCIVLPVRFTYRVPAYAYGRYPATGLQFRLPYPSLIFIAIICQHTTDTTLPTRISSNNYTPWGESLQQAHHLLLIFFHYPCISLRLSIKAPRQGWVILSKNCALIPNHKDDGPKGVSFQFCAFTKAIQAR